MLKVTSEYNLTFDDKQKRLVLADFKRALDFGLPKEHLTAWSEQVRAMAIPLVKEAPLYDGVVELLDSISFNGVKLAVFSSDWDVRGSLDSKGIRNYFEPHIVGGRDVANKKPHPEGIEKAMALMRGDKRKAVMIGDAATDLEAANRAGIDSILFYPKHHSRYHDINDLMAQKPRYTVENHVQLRQILTKSKNGR